MPTAHTHSLTHTLSYANKDQVSAVGVWPSFSSVFMHFIQPQFPCERLTVNVFKPRWSCSYVMLISLAWAPDKMSHIDIQAASSNLKAHWLVKDDVITLLIGSSGAGKEGGQCASKVRGSDGAGDEGGWSGRVIEREDADQLLGGGFCELWYLPCRSVWGYFVTVRTTVMWAAAWALPRIRESHARLQAWGASSANASVTVSVFSRCTCLKCCWWLKWTLTSESMQKLGVAQVPWRFGCF